MTEVKIFVICSQFLGKFTAIYIRKHIRLCGRAALGSFNVVTSAEISPSLRTNDAVCIFSYEYLSEN